MFSPLRFRCSAVMPIRCSYFLDLGELTVYFPLSHEKVYFDCTAAYAGLWTGRHANAPDVSTAIFTQNADVYVLHSQRPEILLISKRTLPDAYGDREVLN